MDDDELLAELNGATGSSDITALKHVRTSAEKRAAEEIANREKCEDFDRFRPLFEQVQAELSSGLRQTKGFERKSEIAPRTVLHPWRPENLCRCYARALYQRKWVYGCTASRDFRQRN